MGLLFAIPWSIDLGFTNINFEVDRERVVDELSWSKDEFLFQHTFI